MITWVQRRGQIKHLLYELCLEGRIDRATFTEQLQDLNNVEPVVRCKDCKYWRYDDCKNDSHGYCPINENDYCSQGKRKGEVTE